MEALFQRASKLPRIELLKPNSIICRNTVSAMQAGIYYGFVGQIDEIVTRIKAEMKRNDIKVIATGVWRRLWRAHPERLTGWIPCLL